MRKYLGTILMFFAGFFPAVTALSQPASARAQTPASAAGAELPVKSAVLFTNGVGYFSREGTVNGSGKIELRFGVKDINDLLKSMVVRDLDGGSIQGVSYASWIPLTLALKGFSLDLSENRGLSGLIAQARGEKADITADKNYTGTIMGLESRPVLITQDRDTLESEELYITLLGAQGIESIPLKAVQRVNFQSPRLREELEAALKLIAENRNSEKKSVFISFAGQGQRRLRAGYITETPVWKTSYRLVIGSGSAETRTAPKSSAPGTPEKHLLQGWGIVENTTDEDWKGIRLELISGMPVSFAMDLYQSLFNPRPTIAYSLQRNLTSSSYAQGAHPAQPAPEPAPSGPARLERRAPSAYEEEQADEFVPLLAEEKSARSKSMDEGNFSLTQGVSPAASGEAAGEFFRYTLENPVDLPRRQSAMLPLLNEEIEGSRISLYNAKVHKKHPMNGLRLKNTSHLNLMGGPITIYEDGVYAGDARMDNLAPGAERFISYSLDLTTEIIAESARKPELITNVKLLRGVLTASRALRRETTYTLINRGASPRTVILEHPTGEGWKLTAPAAFEEKTENLYRFRVETPAEKTGRAALTVAEERILEQTITLINMANDLILFYAQQKEISPASRAALEKLISLKNELAGITRSRETAQSEINTLHKEQERIRGNMANLDRTASLYQRYMSALSEQETSLTTLTNSLTSLREQEAAQRKTIDDYIASLDVK
ncbi:MAG: hypothetical protein LBC67_01560 [Spirochaetales bacterium]|jgi:hypothetical protein|nr:hypothetical protein [Spirochaetales bacterium]